MNGEALPEIPKITAQRVAALLALYRYAFSSEVQLHDRMGDVLKGARIPFVREHVAGPADRFDFLVDGGIVIEAKVKGSLADALRQCLRYAERDDVRAVVLAAARHWAAYSVPESLAGKPFVLVRLQGRAF